MAPSAASPISSESAVSVLSGAAVLSPAIFTVDAPARTARSTSSLFAAYVSLMFEAAIALTPPDAAFGFSIRALPFTSSAVTCFSSSVRSATARSASMI